MLKRLIDVLFSALGLLLLAPVLLLIALWIKAESRGPALFRQERVGLHGKLFRIHKFRTMYSDAGGPLLTVGMDSRITHSGAFLRRYKLDELPQLMDVLVGNMSLVGPRPEVSKYVEQYPPGARRVVLSVRPGITDEASLEYFDESRVLSQAADPERAYVEEILPRKIAAYERYVRNRSTLGDLRVIARTVGRIILPAKPNP